MGVVRSRIKGYKKRLLKKELWDYSQKCFICEKQLPSLQLATLEHVVPLSKDGADDITNIRLVHLKCNHEKDDSLDNYLLNKLSQTNEELKGILEDFSFFT